MSEEYTPTTGHIQDAWTSRQEEFSRTTQEEYDELVAEFDRWLASYEAELREKIAVEVETLPETVWWWRFLTRVKKRITKDLMWRVADIVRTGK